MTENNNQGKSAKSSAPQEVGFVVQKTGSSEQKQHLSTTTHYDEPQQQEIRGNSLVVYIFRILVKLGVAYFLYSLPSPYFLPLTILLAFTEVLELACVYLIKLKPQLKFVLGSISSFVSIGAITVIAQLAGWGLNDFYLVYFLQISSLIIIYGLEVGILSAVLGILSYSLVLYIDQAPSLLYVRLPLLTLTALRFLADQNRWEKTYRALKDFLGVEKSKQDFIALAAHNLRTPVAAIYGYIDILARGDAGKLTQKQEEFIEKIKGNNHSLEKLTEELLQISILEVGNEVNLLKQATQIEVVIERVIEKFDSMIKSKNLTLEFKKPGSLLPLVNIDIEKMQSVISNLVDNSIKYTQQGGIKVEARKDGLKVIISVQDTGAGIPKDELSKVFSKFFRSGNLLVYNQTGVGLGLYLGKKIVELHGGQMWVESAEGKGSTFTFTLPILKEGAFE